MEMSLSDVTNLKECTSPRLFTAKNKFDPEGILSNEIFGINKEDRMNTYAFINLKLPFIHPNKFGIILKYLFKGDISFIVRKYSVENGMLISDDENGWSGLVELYTYWNEIDLDKYKELSILKNISRDNIFITKILVCPPAYREKQAGVDINVSNELNKLYTTLIRSIALIEEGDIFTKLEYIAQTKIQGNIIEINNIISKL